MAGMKPKTILYSIVAMGMAAVAFSPHPATAQIALDSPAGTEMFQDLKTQQATIADNQKQIDDKLAGIGEALRIARIYVSRGGGK